MSEKKRKKWFERVPEIERRQTVAMYAAHDDAAIMVFRDLDVRFSYERDVIHEVLRDGSVCGELS